MWSRSLLIQHTVPFAQIVTFAGEHELFTLPAEIAASDTTVLQQAFANLARIDAQIVSFSAGDLDLRSTMLVALLVMSLIQIARGQILAPASTLLWYALELLSARELRF